MNHKLPSCLHAPVCESQFLFILLLKEEVGTFRDSQSCQEDLQWYCHFSQCEDFGFCFLLVSFLLSCCNKFEAVPLERFCIRQTIQNTGMELTPICRITELEKVLLLFQSLTRMLLMPVKQKLKNQ